MNKRGLGGLVLLMLAVVVIVLALAFTKPVSQVVSESIVQINCTSTDQNKAVCTSLDVTTFLFIGILLGIGGFLLTKSTG